MHGEDVEFFADLDHYSGWTVQQKFRGVRFAWDGQQAWTRQGRPVELPESWQASLPPVPLDCELYDGIDGERRCASAVRWLHHWPATVRLVAFDIPDSTAGPFEERIAQVRQAVGAAGVPWLEAAATWTAGSGEQLREQLEAVQRVGGEGLMLRRPGLHYRAGRTAGMVKLKPA